MATIGYLKRYFNKMIKTEINKLSFHDSPVVEIKAKVNQIVLTIDTAYLSEEHSTSEGKAYWLENCTLTFKDVKQHHLLTWKDDQKPTISFELPDIEEIMSLYFINNKVCIEAFTKNSEWSEWTIYTSEFELIYESKKEVTKKST